MAWLGIIDIQTNSLAEKSSVNPRLAEKVPATV